MNVIQKDQTPFFSDDWYGLRDYWVGIIDYDQDIPDGLALFLKTIKIYCIKNRNIFFIIAVLIWYEKQKYIMKGYLGEFEELVLLTIANLRDEAYGVAILNDISQRTNRKLSLGALHSTLTRLEEKGYIDSDFGEPTKERGGRRKRYFKLTSDAVQALANMKSLRDELWQNADLKLSGQ